MCVCVCKVGLSLSTHLQPQCTHCDSEGVLQLRSGCFVYVPIHMDFAMRMHLVSFNVVDNCTLLAKFQTTKVQIAHLGRRKTESKTLAAVPSLKGI